MIERVECPTSPPIGKQNMNKQKLVEKILELSYTDRVEIHWKIHDASWWASESMPVEMLQEILREWAAFVVESAADDGGE